MRNDYRRTMQWIECCSILGIAPNEDIKVIKKQYLKLIKGVHPDNLGEKGNEEADQKLKLYNEVWDKIKQISNENVYFDVSNEEYNEALRLKIKENLKIQEANENKIEEMIATIIQQISQGDENIDYYYEQINCNLKAIKDNLDEIEVSINLINDSQEKNELFNNLKKLRDNFFKIQKKNSLESFNIIYIDYSINLIEHNFGIIKSYIEDIYQNISNLSTIDHDVMEGCMSISDNLDIIVLNIKQTIEKMDSLFPKDYLNKKNKLINGYQDIIRNLYNKFKKIILQDKINQQQYILIYDKYHNKDTFNEENDFTLLSDFQSMKLKIFKEYYEKLKTDFNKNQHAIPDRTTMNNIRKIQQDLQLLLKVSGLKELNELSRDIQLYEASFYSKLIDDEFNKYSLDNYSKCELNDIDLKFQQIHDYINLLYIISNTNENNECIKKTLEIYEEIYDIYLERPDLFSECTLNAIDLIFPIKIDVNKKKKAKKFLERVFSLYVCKIEGKRDGVDWNLEKICGDIVDKKARTSILKRVDDFYKYPFYSASFYFEWIFSSCNNEIIKLLYENDKVELINFIEVWDSNNYDKSIYLKKILCQSCSNTEESEFCMLDKLNHENRYLTNHQIYQIKNGIMKKPDINRGCKFFQISINEIFRYSLMNVKNIMYDDIDNIDKLVEEYNMKLIKKLYYDLDSIYIKLKKSKMVRKRKK